MCESMAGHAPPKRLRISELNPHLLCALCGGYLIDATTIIECLHSFCKTCILRYLESSNYCPICEVLIHKTRPWQNIRLDHALQNAVYKTVPGLFQNEMQRRREFYHKQNKERRGRVSSSTKDREGRGATECCHGQLGDRVIFSKDEKFSISIEFSPNGKPVDDVVKKNTKRQKNAFPQDKRYLHCPAGLRIEHLKKFIRAKFSLPEDIQIDLFYERDPLCDTYSLMDVAYICMWKRDCVLRLFYSFYEVPLKVPRVDTSVVKLEVQKLLKDGQKALGEGNEEKANSFKTEDEKQQKKRALTDRKSRTQKEEKHQKECEVMPDQCTSAKMEMDTTSEEQDKVKNSATSSNVKVKCSPTLTLRQVKLAEDREVKVVLEKTPPPKSEKVILSPKQEKVVLAKNSLPTKLNQAMKPTAEDRKICSDTKESSEKRGQERSADTKSNLTSDTGHHQEVKSEVISPTPPIGKVATAGMKRKLTESDDTETSQIPGSLPRQQAPSVSKPFQAGPLPSQKDTKPILKTVQDTKQTLSINLGDFKGSVPKYSKPTPSTKDVKPLPLCQMKKLQVNLTSTKMSPTVEINKASCTSHNVKPLTVSSQTMKPVANQASTKTTNASQSGSTVSSPQTLQSVTVALDTKSISASQIAKSSSTSHVTQKSKPLASHKDGKTSKDSKVGTAFKETQPGLGIKETKSSPTGKESKPAVKYAHQSQQTVSYTIVSCGVNGENGKFPPGPNSPKAPLKMLIKSSESKDSKTCFIASGPLGINKGTKHKVVHTSTGNTSPKDPKSSPTKTSVGTSTKSGLSKQKQPKEKKSRHSESKNSWKPKKTLLKASSSSDEQLVSSKAEKKLLPTSSGKSTISQGISKNAQDVYSFVPEEKDDMPPKLKEVHKINPTKPSIVKLTVNTKEAHSGTIQRVFPTAMAPLTLEPEQSEAVNLSQKPQVSDKIATEISKSSSPKPLFVNGKLPVPSNHCQTKVAVSSLSHSNVDNNYTYMYAIDLSKAKTTPKPGESSADTNSTTSVAVSKIPTSSNSQAFPDSQQDMVTSQVENSTSPDTPNQMLNKSQSSSVDDGAVVQLLPRATHNQVIIPNKSTVQQIKVSNSLAMVVANLASNAVSNLVTSIKLASSKASPTESLSAEQPSTTTTKPHIFQVQTSVSDMKTTSITTTSQVPTSSFKPASTETVLAKSSTDASAPDVDNVSKDKVECEGNKKDQISPDSTVSFQATVSTTQTDLPSETSSAPTPEVSSSKLSESKPSSPSSDIPKTIITVPLLPSQANILSRGRTNIQAQAQREKASQEMDNPPTSHKAESSTTLSLAESETSALAPPDSPRPPTVSISSVTSCDSPTTVSISLSPNRSFPTNTTTAPVSNNNSSTIISISLPATSMVKSTSVTSVTSASTLFSSASALKSTDSVTSTLAKKNPTQLKGTVNEEKTFLTSTSRKPSLSKGFDSPGQKLEASVSKLLLPKDPRKIDNFLFDTVPSERESPTSTSSPKPKDILSEGPEEPQSSSFMEDTITSVARGTLPEVSESAPLESSEIPFTAIHQLPKTISQTSKAHAARKSSALIPNNLSTLPSSKFNKNVIQTTKISTLIPKSTSAISKSSMYAKAFPYPALNAIPASRAFLHAAFPHASIMHPDFTAMVNGTNNFVRSLIAAQHASRPVLPQFHSRPLGASYHLPPKATMSSSSSKSPMLQVPPKVSSSANKFTHEMSTKTQPALKSQAVPVSSKSSLTTVTSKSMTLQEQVASSSNSESTGTGNHKSTPTPSSNASGHNQNDKEGKSIKLRAMPPLTIPKSTLGGTTLKLQRSPGSTDHYVLSPTSASVKSHTSHHNHSQGSEKSKSLKESKRSNSVGSGGSRTPTSPLSPKDGVFTGERQRVPTIKISDINRNPIIVDSGASSSNNTTVTSTATKTKNSSNNNHSHNHRSVSASSSSSRPPSASSTSSLSPSSVAHGNNNNISSPNSSNINQRTSSRVGERGSDSSCSPTGSVPERSPARDCRRPPSAEFLLPHHQRWHGFPTAELLFHGFKLPAHAHFQELHYDTDAMPLDYSQSSSKS